MSDQGVRPSATPLSQAQVQPGADPLYRRIDGGNVPLDILKNGVINGAFDWNQRGQATYTVNGASGTYTFDRWVIGSEGPNGSMSLSSQKFGNGDVQSESQFYVRASSSGTSAAGDAHRLSQPIEGSRRYNGRRVVVRGMARRNSGAGSVAIELQQVFGTGGSASVFKYVGTFSPAAIWTPFSFIVDVPAVTAAQILGTSDFLGLVFWLSAGSNFNARLNNLGLQTQAVDFSDIEIKEVMPGYGDQFPGFERLPRDTEQDRCLRYYEVYPLLLYQIGQAGYWGWTTTWRRTKRVAPTLTQSASGSGVAQNNFNATVEAFTVQINCSASAYINGGTVTGFAEY